MSVVFGYRQQEQPQFTPVAKNDFVKMKWTTKDVLFISGLVFLFSLLLMSTLFAVASLAIHWSGNSSQPWGKAFLTMITTTALTSLFAVFIIFLCDRIGIRWERQSRKIYK